MISPNDAAAKWQQNLANAANAMKAGVNGVTVSPTATAATRLDAYIAGVQQAVSSGKMAAKLNGVSLQQWQQAMLTKGVPRVPQGAQQALPKFQAFMAKWLPYQQQGQQLIASMPRGGLEANIARAVQIMRHNAAFNG